MADIQLDFPHDINVSVQLGDLVYWVETNPVGTLRNWASTTTPHDTAPKEEIILIGPVIDLIPWNGNNISEMISDGVHFNTINTSLALPYVSANPVQSAIDALDPLLFPNVFNSGTWYRYSDQNTDPIPLVEEITNTGNINFPQQTAGGVGIIQGLTGLNNSLYTVTVDFIGNGSLDVQLWDIDNGLGMLPQLPQLFGSGGMVTNIFNTTTFQPQASQQNLTIVFNNNFGPSVSIRNISIKAVEQSSIIADYDDAIAAIYGPPSEGDFIMFSKDNKVNLSSLLGYYSLLKLGNNSTSKAEMFSVGANFIESSK
tara:strand:- start:440 stop:1378 length:939 start_codon:yes stop_codon:yes gene_type:complete